MVLSQLRRPDHMEMSPSLVVVLPFITYSLQVSHPLSFLFLLDLFLVMISTITNE